MLFKTQQGGYIEIKKQDFISDIEYYREIIFTKGYTLKINNTNYDNKIIGLLCNTNNKNNNR
tara:strand:+ start:15660 stop:15845 length:186 start_codon:yes stop_codon:yes gene_type:complete